MRILILSTVRTRSSFFIDSVSQFYNLENLYEYYRHLDLQIRNETLFKKPDILWQKYQQATLEKTKSIKDKNNFALKLHPSNFINVYKYHLSEESVWCMNDKDDIMPWSYLNLDGYDKIFYLTRNNFTNLYCSWLHGMSREKLLYTKEDIVLSKLHNSKMQLHFEPKTAKVLMFDIIILEYFYKKFQSNGKEVIKLDYEQTVDYVTENFSGTKSKYIDVQFNYKELVKNYNEIEDRIELTKQELYKEINWDLFSE